MAKQAPKLIYSLRVTKKKSYKRHSESSSNLVRELFCGEIVKKVHILPFKINHSFEQVLKKSKPTWIWTDPCRRTTWDRCRSVGFLTSPWRRGRMLLGRVRQPGLYHGTLRNISACIVCPYIIQAPSKRSKTISNGQDVLKILKHILKMIIDS